MSVSSVLTTEFAVIAFAIATAACGHSDSYRVGYDAGNNPTLVRLDIKGGGHDDGHGTCQMLLTEAKLSTDHNNVDASDFTKGCIDGYQHALKEV